MNEMLSLFTKGGTVTALIFLALVGISGILIGKIKVFNVKLGIAGVLFTGLFFGHLGANIDPHILHFIKEFGLILFVYSIGLEVGPRFMSSLKDNGLKLNLLASGIVFTGAGVAAAIKFTFNIPTPAIIGIMCGAVTNTPSLGAAQQVITEYQGTVNSGITGMGYAVAYPFGIIGIILVMFLLRAIFKVSIKKEELKFHEEVSCVSGDVLAVNLLVKNPALIGKNIAFVAENLDGDFAISRILRDEEFIVPRDEVVIEEGDVLYGVSNPKSFSHLELNVGPIEGTDEIEVTGRMGMKTVIFTNKDLAGKTLKGIGLSRRFPVNITRIYRAGNVIVPKNYDTIEFGDTVRIVGEKDSLKPAAELLGNSLKSLYHPNIIPLLIGIFAGVLLGSIPIAIPGLPAPVKLGLAGGPLLVALFLGHKGRIGKMSFYSTPSSNLFIRELGIILFLACVGLGAGEHFVNTIMNGGYMWMLYGALITFIPLLIFGVIASIMKINHLTICGLLAGASTDPPALEFANSISSVQAQSTAYATVYPLVMFLRVLIAQVLAILLL